jgi:hypothetical protein
MSKAMQIGRFATFMAILAACLGVDAGVILGIGRSWHWIAAWIAPLTLIASLLWAVFRVVDFALGQGARIAAQQRTAVAAHDDR